MAALTLEVRDDTAVLAADCEELAQMLGVTGRHVARDVPGGECADTVCGLLAAARVLVDQATAVLGRELAGAR